MCTYLPGWAKEWFLGCVIPASWLLLAAEARFTQPRAHLLADPCTTYVLSFTCLLAENCASRLHAESYRAEIVLLMNGTTET